MTTLRKKRQLYKLHAENREPILHPQAQTMHIKKTSSQSHNDKQKKCQQPSPTTTDSEQQMKRYPR